jgi:hypothetical protein
MPPLPAVSVLGELNYGGKPNCKIKCHKKDDFPDTIYLLNVRREDIVQMVRWARRGGEGSHQRDRRVEWISNIKNAKNSNICVCCCC